MGDSGNDEVGGLFKIISHNMAVVPIEHKVLF